MATILKVTSDMFLQMIKSSDFLWQDIITAIKKKNITISEVTDATICNPTVMQYPPSTTYIKSFLKRLIYELEANEIEVSDMIYDKYICLVSKKQMEEEFHYCTYKVNTDIRITLKETRSIIAEGTTGLTTWAASHVLAQYILRHSSNFKFQRILELGSGLGLTGLTLIKGCHPKSYTFTDHHPKVMEFLEDNIKMNLDYSCNEKAKSDYHWQGTDVHLRSLDWESPSNLQEYDYVIGADILFDISLIPCIVELLTSCLATENSKAIVAAALRNEDTFNYFMKESDANGLQVEHAEQVTYKASASQPSIEVKIVQFSLAVQDLVSS